MYNYPGVSFFCTLSGMISPELASGNQIQWVYITRRKPPPHQPYQQHHTPSYPPSALFRSLSLPYNSCCPAILHSFIFQTLPKMKLLNTLPAFFSLLTLSAAAKSVVVRHVPSECSAGSYDIEICSAELQTLYNHCYELYCG